MKQALVNLLLIKWFHVGYPMKVFIVRNNVKTESHLYLFVLYGYMLCFVKIAKFV